MWIARGLRAAGQQFYQQQATEQGSGAGAGESADPGEGEPAGAGARAGTDDVVDADYEIVDDK